MIIVFVYIRLSERPLGHPAHTAPYGARSGVPLRDRCRPFAPAPTRAYAHKVHRGRPVRLSAKGVQHVCIVKRCAKILTAIEEKFNMWQGKKINFRAVTYLSEIYIFRTSKVPVLYFYKPKYAQKSYLAAHAQNANSVQSTFAAHTRPYFFKNHQVQFCAVAPCLFMFYSI